MQDHSTAYQPVKFHHDLTSSFGTRRRWRFFGFSAISR